MRKLFRQIGPALACAMACLLSTPALAENPLDASRAYGYLQQVCDLGPRPSGSEAMQEQIDLLESHFEPLADRVEKQGFLAPNPLGGPKVRMTNLIIRFHPELRQRVLLCCHYDTRPLPDQDRNPQARRSGTFIGANDGGSGVAVLMELAHHLKQLDGGSLSDGGVGVDLVMFDGEELVYTDRPDGSGDPYFLGSRWFARKYKQRTENYDYVAGVLLDMVGDADLQLYYERNSWASRRSRAVVRGLWETAARLGVKEFIPRMKHTVRDDHLPLNAAGIPTCDVIDFDYPFWHTEQDLPANCSGESLAKVGWVVLEWLKEVDAEAAKGAAAKEVAQ